MTYIVPNRAEQRARIADQLRKMPPRIDHNGRTIEPPAPVEPAPPALEAQPEPEPSRPQPDPSQGYQGAPVQTGNTIRDLARQALKQ